MTVTPVRRTDDIALAQRGASTRRNALLTDVEMHAAVEARLKEEFNLLLERCKQ